MINPYSIILSLFIVAGLFATIWGWRIIINGRKTLNWPRTEGIIEESRSSDNDFLPLIHYRYTVAEQTFQQKFEFPPGTSPSNELTSSYLKKYIKGAKVSVSYDPDHAEKATIEPGLANGDWFVFVLGVLTTLFGILFLFFS